MLDDVNRTKALPSETMEICDDLAVPITIADPKRKDTPLIYVNSAFERMTQYAAKEVLGRNCRFLQGDLTDRTVTDELAHSCAKQTSDDCCLINYRKDGSIFFNLLAIEPLRVNPARKLLMGCHFAFRPTQTGGTLARTSAVIDRAQRQLRLGRRSGPNSVNIHDTYRLDTIAMRFETAFIRVKNTLIKTTNARMLDELRARRRRDAERLPARTRWPADGLVSL